MEIIVIAVLTVGLGVAVYLLHKRSNELVRLKSKDSGMNAHLLRQRVMQLDDVASSWQDKYSHKSAQAADLQMQVVRLKRRLKESESSKQPLKKKAKKAKRDKKRGKLSSRLKARQQIKKMLTNSANT